MNCFCWECPAKGGQASRPHEAAGVTLGNWVGLEHRYVKATNGSLNLVEPWMADNFSNCELDVVFFSTDGAGHITCLPLSTQDIRVPWLHFHYTWAVTADYRILGTAGGTVFVTAARGQESASGVLAKVGAVGCPHHYGVWRQGQEGDGAEVFGGLAAGPQGADPGVAVPGVAVIQFCSQSQCFIC